jgi:hypothetical protein
MQPTITQNGALYAMQHRSPQEDRGPRQKRKTADQLKVGPILRTSIGEFVLEPVPADKDFSLQQEIADAPTQYRVAA